ncbi:uncharacterized protein [Scyliorhinus torazame]|uniref:uncharacterized protein n=1 Tax=Scyliorhinus torazame TaxID=75743 RepID=UPI003B5BA6CB
MIEKAAMYKAAVTTLKAHFMKTVNEVFARHLLTTRRQRAGESLDEYLENLTLLARNCSYRDVTAEEHMNRQIRDTYVAGVRSNYIRQRLLDNGTTDLWDMVKLATSLEVTYQSLSAFPADPANPSWTPSSRPPSDPTTSQACAARLPIQIGESQCYLCGQGQHSRQRCPACTATCSDCGKKGHFARVCLGRPKAQKSKTHQALPMDSQARRPRNVAACQQRTPPSDASPASWRPPCWLLAPAPADTCDDGGGHLGHHLRPRPPFCDTAYHTGYPQLGAVTLDQSQPKHLKNSMMLVRVNGHETPCLFDSGSTESFVHPDTVRRCSLHIYPDPKQSPLPPDPIRFRSGGTVSLTSRCRAPSALVLSCTSSLTSALPYCLD